MENQLANINREIGEIKIQLKSTNKRVDNIEKVTESIHEMATSVGVMANEMAHMKDDISNINKNINIYHNNNDEKKLIFNAKNAVIVGVIGALVTAFMALILK